MLQVIITIILFGATACMGVAQRVIIRGDTTRNQIALVFTGHDYSNGGDTIRKSLALEGVKGSFFLTGDFYREKGNQLLIAALKADGHYLGAHSDQHLLYADWKNRDSLLVTKEEFVRDLQANEREMARFGVLTTEARYFLPPYEWYNDSIVHWTYELGRQLVNYSPGTVSHADYTSPKETNYRSSQVILESIQKKEALGGLRGFILLLHIGVSPERPDPFFYRLPQLIQWLKQRGYTMVRIDELLR